MTGPNHPHYAEQLAYEARLAEWQRDLPARFRHAEGLGEIGGVREPERPSLVVIVAAWSAGLALIVALWTGRIF